MKMTRERIASSGSRYPARDKWLLLCMENEDAGFSQLCESLDSPGLASDARLDSAEKRERNAAQLIELLDQALQQRSAAEWMARWEPLGIVASPILYVPNSRTAIRGVIWLRTDGARRALTLYLHTSATSHAHPRPFRHV